jgi:CubicO group peptidase (beta-lactamase class C family)
MFITGSYVVAKLSGMAYRDFVEKRIMLPLNMSSSTMHPDRVSKSDRFSQTWTPSGRRIPFFATEQAMDLIAGAGGVISTAEDLVRFQSSGAIGFLTYCRSTVAVGQTDFEWRGGFRDKHHNYPQGHLRSRDHWPIHSHSSRGWPSISNRVWTWMGTHRISWS